MKDIHLIDNCQAHLPVRYAFLTLNSFVRSDTGVLIDSELQPSCTCKTSLLFAPLAVFTMSVPLFHFTLQQNGYHNCILNTKQFFS